MPLGLLFVMLLPALLILTSQVDLALKIPRFYCYPINPIITAMLIVTGLIFAFWSNKAVFVDGEGTPAPMMATQHLIITGPFKYCRNPMALGTILIYLGVVVYLGSLSSLLLLMILTGALLTYIKRIEEKELEVRFKQEYIKYKELVPFIIPWKRRHQKKY
jgi:protein-S-isoprenylcysteine O-methyltransferase Ste14